MSTPTVKLNLIQLGAELVEENNAAADLWSWLPSHTIAAQHHGYASNHRPSNRDVMVEASMYLAHLKHPEVTLTPEEQEWFTKCPCGEEHVPHSTACVDELGAASTGEDGLVT